MAGKSPCSIGNTSFKCLILYCHVSFLGYLFPEQCFLCTNLMGLGEPKVHQTTGCLVRFFSKLKDKESQSNTCIYTYHACLGRAAFSNYIYIYTSGSHIIHFTKLKQKSQPIQFKERFTYWDFSASRLRNLHGPRRWRCCHLRRFPKISIQTFSG